MHRLVEKWYGDSTNQKTRTKSRKKKSVFLIVVLRGTGFLKHHSVGLNGTH